MNSVIEKEKKLNLALTKLKNLNFKNPDIKKNIDSIATHIAEFFHSSHVQHNPNDNDGYDIKVYRSNPFDDKTISGNRVWTSFKDKKGNAWFGSDNSVDYYNWSNDTFERYQTDSRPTNFFQDKDGITALMVAIVNDQPDIEKQILDKEGIDINNQNK